MRKIIHSVILVFFFTLMAYYIMHQPMTIIDLSHFDSGHYLALEDHNARCETFIEHPQKKQNQFLIIGPYASSAEGLKAHSQLQNCAKTIHIIAKT